MKRGVPFQRLHSGPPFLSSKPTARNGRASGKGSVFTRHILFDAAIGQLPFLKSYCRVSLPLSLLSATLARALWACHQQMQLPIALSER